MVNSLKVAIIEPSPIIRAGLESLLKKISGYKIQIKIINEDISNELANIDVDVIFGNPSYIGLNPKKIYDIASSIKIIAISKGDMPQELYNEYDDILNIWSDIENIEDLINRIFDQDGNQENKIDAQSLTPREREIIICVAKGMKNKKIASELYLSTHTVITHRRNITKKLGIHSTSGLIMYAVMNKLVDLSSSKQIDNNQ